EYFTWDLNFFEIVFLIPFIKSSLLEDLQGKKPVLIERIVSEEITRAARTAKAKALKGN
ncbi:MAG: hypothetical protein GWP19_07165, partial [Planctomycetia bacterium]|nr:hypothetical protein [Planctomycetia bacterium]